MYTKELIINKNKLLIAIPNFHMTGNNENYNFVIFQMYKLIYIVFLFFFFLFVIHFQWNSNLYTVLFWKS